MRGRVLVLGANGFIGSHVAAALSSAGWSVRAGTRRIAEPARRAPTFDWVVADFAKLTTPPGLGASAGRRGGGGELRRRASEWRGRQHAPPMSTARVP